MATVPLTYAPVAAVSSRPGTASAPHFAARLSSSSSSSSPSSSSPSASRKRPRAARVRPPPARRFEQNQSPAGLPSSPSTAPPATKGRGEQHQDRHHHHHHVLLSARAAATQRVARRPAQVVVAAPPPPSKSSPLAPPPEATATPTAAAAAASQGPQPVRPPLQPSESCFATVSRQTSPSGADHAERANVEARQARRRRARSTRLDASPLQDPFKAYMEEISRSDLLDYASVLALASSIKAGAAVETAQRELEDRAGDKPTLGQLAAHLDMTSEEVQRTLYAGTVAKNDLVAANLRLVSSIARKIEMTKTSTAGIALDDMIQEGNVGLIRAAEKYDASRGYRFSTYATWWIRASVLRAITNQSRPIKVPSSIVEDYQRIRKERDRQVAAGMRGSDDRQVAEALGMTPAKVRFVVSVVTGSVTSLDLALGRYSSDGSSRTLLEVLPGDDNVEERMVESMQRAELDRVLRFCLKPTERAAIRLRFGLDDGHPRTLREVGELLTVSKERVRQLVFTALSKLKTPEVHTALVDFLS